MVIFKTSSSNLSMGNYHYYYYVIPGPHQIDQFLVGLVTWQQGNNLGSHLTLYAIFSNKQKREHLPGRRYWQLPQWIPAISCHTLLANYFLFDMPVLPTLSLNSLIYSFILYGVTQTNWYLLASLLIKSRWRWYRLTPEFSAQTDQNFRSLSISY